MLATEVRYLAIAFGVESGRSVHGHSADGIDGLGVGYIDGFNFLRCCDVNFGADLKKRQGNGSGDMGC